MRIVIVGTSGSGKSTLGKQLSALLKIPHIELDALNWEPGWVQAPKEVFRTRVEFALAGDAWIVDGNYGPVRDFTWQRADTLIWLDYPFPIVFGRALSRTLRRVFRREELWSGNRESLRKSFFSKDSILLWVMQTYWRRKREYPAMLELPQYAHLKVMRFQTPAATKKYVHELRTVLD